MELDGCDREKARQQFKNFRTKFSPEFNDAGDVIEALEFGKLTKYAYKFQTGSRNSINVLTLPGLSKLLQSKDVVFPKDKEIFLKSIQQVSLGKRPGDELDSAASSKEPRLLGFDPEMSREMVAYQAKAAEAVETTKTQMVALNETVNSRFTEITGAVEENTSILKAQTAQSAKTEAAFKTQAAGYAKLGRTVTFQIPLAVRAAQKIGDEASRAVKSQADVTNAVLRGSKDKDRRIESQRAMLEKVNKQRDQLQTEIPGIKRETSAIKNDISVVKHDVSVVKNDIGLIKKATGRVLDRAIKLDEAFAVISDKQARTDKQLKDMDKRLDGIERLLGDVLAKLPA